MKKIMRIMFVLCLFNFCIVDFAMDQKNSVRELRYNPSLDVDKSIEIKSYDPILHHLGFLLYTLATNDEENHADYEQFTESLKALIHSLIVHKCDIIVQRCGETILHITIHGNRTLSILLPSSFSLQRAIRIFHRLKFQCENAFLCSNELSRSSSAAESASAPAALSSEPVPAGQEEHKEELPPQNGAPAAAHAADAYDVSDSDNVTSGRFVYAQSPGVERMETDAPAVSNYSYAGANDRRPTSLDIIDKIVGCLTCCFRNS